MRISMLKRDFRLFIRCLLPAVALTMVFAVVCVAASLVATKGAEAVYTPVKAAVVDGEDSFFSRVMVNTVANMEYIRDLMDISVLEYEEAMDGLRSGELAAVIILPEGTVDGILAGKDTRGTIYLSPAAAAHADVVSSAATFGELMLAAGQYGIFSGEGLIWSNGMEQQFRADFLSKYNARLMNEAIRAEDRYFDLHVTDYADTNMATAAYYALCWLSLLLLLTAMFFSRLYTEDLNKPILTRLRGFGVTDGAFLAGKILFPFLFQLVLLTAVLVGISGFVELNVNAVTLYMAAVGGFLAAVVGCAVIMTLDRGVPVVAAVSVAGLLLCGGIIPRQLLPNAVLTVGSITPYGAVLGLLSPVFGGRYEILPLLAALLYMVILPVAVRCRLMQIRIGGEAL